MKKDVKTAETFAVRSLTRGEIKKLRAAGLDLSIAAFDSKQEAAVATAKLIDFVLETVYPETDFDDMPYNEAVALAMKIYKKTFGSEEEEKN